MPCSRIEPVGEVGEPRLTLLRVPVHVVYPSRRHVPRRVRVVVEALAGMGRA